MNELIAVIDDEPDILELVALHLKNAGFQVREFTDGRQFFHFLNSTTPALLLLDLMLPDIDGLEICKTLKSKPEYAQLPIIMLTAKGEELDKVLGLELGADDYITKPFSPREFIARVKAVLRRFQTTEIETLIVYQDELKIDDLKHEVFLHDQAIELTATEYNLLKILTRKPGVVFSRGQLLDSLWGTDKIVVNRTIDVHIKNLREKLGVFGNRIKNIRGIGYKLD
jgi:two-component system phosphate regulon response regulator PhoB/two-component system alkaline phosphatase synthesis response regulator PhoP